MHRHDADPHENSIHVLLVQKGRRVCVGEIDQVEVSHHTTEEPQPRVDNLIYISILAMSRRVLLL